MEHTFPVPDPVTPAWLTAVLREEGRLPTGDVQAVEQETTGSSNSATFRLLVRYSPDVMPGAPTHLVLKRNISSGWGVEAGADEVSFYTLIASLPDHPDITVPCYAATYDQDTGDSFLLLQDLTATHQPPVTRQQQISVVQGVPSAEEITQVIDTLAQLHAYWWERLLLDTERFPVGYWSCTAERFLQYVEKRSASWRRLIGAESSWLPLELQALYEGLLARLPDMWERYLEPRFRTRHHLTLVHGDAYFCNFLCPRAGAHGPTYLLDWQSPGFDIGSYDLVNLCATFWTSGQRHQDQREKGILRRYLRMLQDHGVREYGWRDLEVDYQLGLIFWVLMPVQDAADGSDKDYWWPKMRCLTAAFRDWRCAALLDRLEKS